jgi:hypothetical protein
VVVWTRASGTDMFASFVVVKVVVAVVLPVLVEEVAVCPGTHHPYPCDTAYPLHGTVRSTPIRSVLVWVGGAMTQKAPPISDCAWLTKRLPGEPSRITLLL